MARSSSRIILRNNFIRSRYRHHRKRNPKWTIVAVIEETADEVFLSPATITKILRELDEDVPAIGTIAKYTRAQGMLY